LIGNNSVTDVTLTGTVTWTAGSDIETGTATMYAKGTGESRVDLALTSSTHSDVRNDTLASYPQGASAVNGSALSASAIHNCWINAGWFFPALSFLANTSDSTLIFSYIGQETRNGESVQHVRIYRYLTTQSAATTSLTQQVSTADYYLDSTSLLPSAVTFNSHPDDDATTNIAIEVDFSNYQNVGGVQVPMHIQKYISGGIALDVTLTSSVFNSGLSDSLFAVQ
jgi:hypothetical protein